MGDSAEFPPSEGLECKEERTEGSTADTVGSSSSDDDIGISRLAQRRMTRPLGKRSKGQKGSQDGFLSGTLTEGRRCHNKINGSSSSQNCESPKDRRRRSRSNCHVRSQSCDTPVKKQCRNRKKRRHTETPPSRETSGDEKTPASSLNSNPLSRETSSGEGVSNTIIDFKKNMQSSEHATCVTVNDMESTKLNQCINKVKEETELLGPAVELPGTCKLIVEGVFQDKINLDLHAQSDQMHIGTSSPMVLETSSLLFRPNELTQDVCNFSSNVEMIQENVMDKAVTPISGSKARKKRVVHKSPLQHTLSVINEKETCSPLRGTSQSQCWDKDALCDLCHQGPSLQLGGWFCVHCGSPVANCLCPQSKEPGDNDINGKVHKLCALWSSNTFKDRKGSIQGLLMVVKQGKLSKCAKCQKYGASIACCMNTCSLSFHYSCADVLASRLRCAMWKQESKCNLACDQHRLAARMSQKDVDLLLKLKRRLKRVRIESGSSQESQGRLLYKFQSVFTKSDLAANENDTLIDISSDSEGEDNVRINDSKTDGDCDIRYWRNEVGGFMQMDPTDPRVSGHGGILHCIGDNLLCTDISKGWEAVHIPCTNDVDSAPAPDINYINKSRCRANAKDVYKSLFMMKENISRPCKGCNYHDLDNPHKEASSHLVLKDSQRHTDTRIDWQGQPMCGQNSYDQYGRLQLGPEIDIVECNDRCPCEAECLNKELQKGLRFHLEVYRTENRLWAVRTTEQIPRGKFVVEFAGEIVTHENAHKLRGEYDLTKLSCFACKSRDLLMVDGHRMSNVARFIGHSSQGNLGIHRVYTETIDPRFYRMGLYAARDIEIGEELLLQKISDIPDCRLMDVCFPPMPRRSDELMYVAE